MEEPRVMTRIHVPKNERIDGKTLGLFMLALLAYSYLFCFDVDGIHFGVHCWNISHAQKMLVILSFHILNVSIVHDVANVHNCQYFSEAAGMAEPFEFEHTCGRVVITMFSLVSAWACTRQA